MYHSIDPGPPILNGCRSHYPGDFPRRMALVARIPALQALAELSTGLRHVWLHADRLGPKQLATWNAFGGAGEVRLRPVVRDGADRPFEVDARTAAR
jgi:hypothetical protein